VLLQAWTRKQRSVDQQRTSSIHRNRRRPNRLDSRVGRTRF
jgi:hypothetical protein